jgi:hypothetical protein
MPTLRKPKFRDDEIVVCWEPVAHGDYVIRRGERLRGSHDVVKAVPGAFVADGTPIGEMPNVWDVVPEPVQDEHNLVHIPPPIPDEDAAVAVSGFTIGGRYVGKGARFRRDDPLVKAHPQFFRTPAMPLG